MVGDVDDNKVSSVQNFRSLGGVEAPNSYNDQGRTEGQTDILQGVQSCFATKNYLATIVNKNSKKMFKQGLYYTPYLQLINIEMLPLFYSGLGQFMFQNMIETLIEILIDC